MDKLEFDLGPATSIITDFDILPEDRMQGGSEAVEAIRLFVGNRPSIFNLKTFYEKTGKEVPDTLKAYSAYNLFLLTNNVGVMQEGNKHKITHIGYEQLIHEQDQAAVMEMMPQGRYIKLFGAELSFEAGLNLDGSLTMPDSLEQMLSQVEALDVSAKLEASAQAGIVGKISFPVYTTEIEAVGQNSKRVAWRFARTDQPLTGRNITVSQILIVDMLVNAIRLKVCGSVNYTTWLGFARGRKETPWIDVDLALPS